MCEVFKMDCVCKVFKDFYTSTLYTAVIQERCLGFPDVILDFHNPPLSTII